MDLAAIAESAVEIWVKVENNLTAKGYNDIAETSKIEIFKEAMSLKK